MDFIRYSSAKRMATKRMDVPFSLQGSLWSRPEVTGTNCTRRAFISTEEIIFCSENTQWKKAPEMWWSPCCQRFSRCSCYDARSCNLGSFSHKRWTRWSFEVPANLAVLWLCGYCLVWKQFFQSEVCYFNDGIIGLYIHLLSQLWV